MKNCTICSKLLSGRQSKFCSKECKQKDINLRHQNYSNQGDRGMKNKIKLLNLLGGKCTKCGYNKNYSALCFHHTRDKLFQLDVRKCSNTKWDSLIEEANKCILLCHNCHMEEHYPQHSMVGPSGLEPETNKL